MSIDLSITKNQAGNDIYELIKKLFPICRCITGNGVRESLKIIKEVISELEIHEVPSGTQVFDWTVPKEWNIRDAYIKDSNGERMIDFKKSNLHVVNYSVPVRKKMSLQELKNHIFTLPDYPDWIPYRTSYYEENWGFCMSHTQYLGLKEGDLLNFYHPSSTGNRRPSDLARPPSIAALDYKHPYISDIYLRTYIQVACRSN